GEELHQIGMSVMFRHAQLKIRWENRSRARHSHQWRAFSLPLPHLLDSTAHIGGDGKLAAHHPFLLAVAKPSTAQGDQLTREIFYPFLAPDHPQLDQPGDVWRNRQFSSPCRA